MWDLVRAAEADTQFIINYKSASIIHENTQQKIHNSIPLVIQYCKFLTFLFGNLTYQTCLNYMTPHKCILMVSQLLVHNIYCNDLNKTNPANTAVSSGVPASLVSLFYIVLNIYIIYNFLSNIPTLYHKENIQMG